MKNRKKSVSCRIKYRIPIAFEFQINQSSFRLIYVFFSINVPKIAWEILILKKKRFVMYLKIKLDIFVVWFVPFS